MMPQVIALGEMLIDFVAQDHGRLGHVGGFTKHPGGAPANVAVGLSRLGIESGFIGKLGDDDFGRYLHQVLTDNRVDTRGVRFSTEAHTALAFVSLSDRGERDFTFYRHPGADELLSAAEIDSDDLQRAQVFHFGSLSLTHPSARAATHYAVEQAQKGELIVSFDPNVRPALWKQPEQLKQAVENVVSAADILKLSLEDASFLLGEQTPEKLLEILFEMAQPQLLILTLGAQGCLYQTPQWQGEVQGFHVHPVDTTGAGDGFMAGLLAYLIGHKQIKLAHLPETTVQKALRYAHAVAALTVTQPGAISALPTVETVEAFLR